MLSKKLNSQVQETEVKLNRLLDGYLDQVIEPEIYKQKKNELFDEKLKLVEKKSRAKKIVATKKSRRKPGEANLEI